MGRGGALYESEWSWYLAAMGRSTPLVLVLALSAGCILRPESQEAARRSFDRTGLADVIHPAPPATGLAGGIARFNDGIEITGITVSNPSPSAGETVTVDAWYHAAEAPFDNWKVFVHVEAPDNRLDRINADHEPASGRYPTQRWQAGEYVLDRYTFTVPTHLAGRTLEIWTGFYRGDDRLELENKTGIRHDGRNRVRVGVLRPSK